MRVGFFGFLEGTGCAASALCKEAYAKSMFFITKERQ
jgi:hypothetical protein